MYVSLEKKNCLPINDVPYLSLPLQSVMEVANFCAAMDTLIDQDDGAYVMCICIWQSSFR